MPTQHLDPKIKVLNYTYPFYLHTYIYIIAKKPRVPLTLVKGHWRRKIQIAIYRQLKDKKKERILVNIKTKSDRAVFFIGCISVYIHKFNHC